MSEHDAIEQKQLPEPESHEDKITKKINIFWYLIAIGVFFIFLLMLLSSVLNVGERLTTIHPYLAYGFYVLVTLVVYFLIINPIRIILIAPSFSVATVLDNKNPKTKAIYKRVAKNLLKENDITEKDKLLLRDSLKDQDKLQHALQIIFERTIKQSLNKIIVNNAKTVLISTAISQNGRLDMITVMVVNIKMIKELVIKCGFRPSFKNLSKLTINVFTTALIAEGLENINFDEMFPNSTTGIFQEIPFIKPITSSIVNGISNALLTARIGIVARRYLFSDGKAITKNEIRRLSLKESIAILPSIIKDAMFNFPERFKKMFTKKASEETSN